MPSVLEHPRNRFQPMRAQGNPGQKLAVMKPYSRLHERRLGPGHTEDVLAKPFQQPGDVVVQRDRRVTRSTGVAEPLG